MPKIFGKKGKNNTTKKEVKQIAFLILIIMFCVFFAFNLTDSLKKVITNNYGSFQSQKIEVSSCYYYAVSVCDFDNRNDANNFAVRVKSYGGAGVVYNSGKYYVFASIYPSLIEAQEIQNNLCALSYDAKIVNLKVSNLSKSYFGNNGKIFCEAISFFRLAFENIYNLVLSFDEGKMSKSEVEKKLVLQNANLANIKNKLLQTNDRVLNGAKNVILKSLGQLKVIIQDAINYPKEGFSSFLKFCCFNIVFEHQNLLNLLNNNQE